MGEWSRKRLLCAGVAACLAGLVAAAPAPAAVSFFGPVNYDVEASPRDIAAAPLWNSRYPGIVTANRSDNSVSVLSQTPAHDGTFLPAVAWPAGIRPTAVAIGRLLPEKNARDLVVVDEGDNRSNSNTVAALFGRGVANDRPLFTAPSLRGMPGWPGSGLSALALGDFRNLGKPDVVVVDQARDTLQMLPSLSAKTPFPPPLSPNPVGGAPSAVAAGDFDRDGKLDAVTANLAGTVSALLGNGDGTFQPQITSSASWQPSRLATGDFDRDGKLDVAVVNSGANTVSVLLGDGAGRFRIVASNHTGPWAEDVAAGDFDRDGKLDLAVAMSNPTPGNGGVSVLPGRGDGSFGDPQPTIIGPNAEAIAAADFNEDTRPDLATANPDADSVSVLLNTTGFAGWFRSPGVKAFSDQPVGTSSAESSWALGITGPPMRAGVTFQATRIKGPDAGDFRITSDGCANTTINPVEGCIVKGVFEPRTAGAKRATMVFTDAQDEQLDSHLRGTATAPDVGIVPAGKAFGSRLAGTESAPQTFTAENTGTAPLQISAASLVGVDPDQFALSNDTCTDASLDPGQTCTVEARFAPSRSGQVTAQLALADNAGSGQQTVPLSGVGAWPQLDVQPPSHDFGAVNTDEQSDVQAFTLTNESPGAIGLTASLAGDGAGQYAIVSGDCPAPPAQLPVDASCEVGVRFQPTATGIALASLALATAPGDGVVHVALEGRGAVPGFGISPSTLDYGEQPVGTRSSDHRFTVSNTGDGPLRISQVTLGGEAPEQFATSDDRCTNTTLAPGRACRVEVAYAPRRAGPAGALLRFADNAPGTDHTVPLLGTGTAPDVEMAPPDVAFGAVPVGTTSPPQVFTVTNMGSAPLDVKDVSVAGTDAAEFELGATNCWNVSVPPGEQCMIEVAFAPHGIGTRFAVLTITDNTSGGQQVAPLTGVGTGPELTLQPLSASFGGVRVDTSSEWQAFQAENTGNSPLTLSTVSLVGSGAAAFALDPGTCTDGLVLEATESCQARVQFQPPALGPHDAAIAFEDAAGNGEQRAALVGVGTEPGAIIDPTTVELGSARLGEHGPRHEVTVSSAGSAPLSVHGVQVVGPNSAEIAIVHDGCSARTFAIGEHCTVELELAPASIGLKQATLAISEDAPGGPRQVALTGTGTSALPPSAPAPLAIPRLPRGAFARGSANEIYLACSSSAVRLIDVTARGRRVSLTGVAEPELVGRRVDILLGHRRVGKTRVRTGGKFSASVRAPSSARARYRAKVSGSTSQRLGLGRRIVDISLVRRGKRLLLRGRVTRPFARRPARIAVERYLSCKRRKKVRLAAARPARNGRFKISIPVPRGVRAAMYRARTRVATRRNGPPSATRFSLPQAIDLGQ